MNKLSQQQIKVNILEVVLARATDTDGRGRLTKKPCYSFSHAAEFEFLIRGGYHQLLSQFSANSAGF
ncbi:MAG: hypothetical protein IPH35_24500 [Rhodoferax sp.]|nr:hypothetical protein [Rhodoferax sp.]